MILCGDSGEMLKTLDPESINCCVTSPPYYGLRYYGGIDEIGQEETPEKYIERLKGVFREVKRVLRADGTLWLNIGDSYSGSGKGGAFYPHSTQGTKQATNAGSVDKPGIIKTTRVNGCKRKDLIGIPWMLAFALRADGWYLRQDIIWAKPNPMPESVKDRCTRSHEYIFLLSKSPKYYYDHDAIKEPTVYSIGSTTSKKQGGLKKKHHAHEDFKHISDSWTVPTKPYRGAHFATFPPNLIEPCILAGCPVGGVVLDPFAGSGTTGYVSKKNGRKYVLIDSNGDYCRLAEERILREVSE